MFHESLKNSLIGIYVKMQCEINVKLVFHEIPWKKSLTV